VPRTSTTSLQPLNSKVQERQTERRRSTAWRPLQRRVSKSLLLEVKDQRQAAKDDPANDENPRRPLCKQQAPLVNYIDGPALAGRCDRSFYAIIFHTRVVFKQLVLFIEPKIDYVAGALNTRPSLD
jgi:hypothetical protein